MLRKITLKQTGLTEDDYRKHRKDDLWMTAEEALKYGVIDEIPIYLQRQVDKEDMTISSECWNYAYSVNPQEEEESDEETE